MTHRSMAAREGIDWGSRLLVVALSTVVLAGCDPAPPNLGIGFRQQPGQRFGEVQFIPCPGNLIRGVRLVHDPDHIVGNSEDTVLWSVAASTPSSQRVFVIGEDPPTGFREMVPIAAQTLSGEDLDVIVQLQRGSQFLVLSFPAAPTES
jgi:hypothetical protein